MEQEAGQGALEDASSTVAIKIAPIRWCDNIATTWTHIIFRRECVVCGAAFLDQESFVCGVANIRLEEEMVC